MYQTGVRAGIIRPSLARSLFGPVLAGLFGQLEFLALPCFAH